MIFVFYFFAAILILLSARSFIGGIDYLRFFKAELSKPNPAFTPMVCVVAPCRGMEPGLEQNLQALFDLDYPAYEVVFVVDDENDEAVQVIRKISDTAVTPTALIIAAEATDSSQKVENLRTAVLHAADDSQAFVFVDSDVRPSANWLRHLVAPLQDGNVGAATGYRWFISTNSNLASEMRSAWNASIATALGPNTKSNFCWGGSMAISRSVFESVDMREKWKGTLSDDFAVTRAMNDAGLPIVFVPQAMAASLEDCSFGGLLEFTTRQMKITRVYAPQLWLLSLFGSAVFNAVMITAFLITISGSSDNFAILTSILTLTLVTIFSAGKAWLRLSAVRLVLSNYARELDRQSWAQYSLWALTPAVFFYNSLAAWTSRRLTWRGTTYELKSPRETVIISP